MKHSVRIAPSILTADFGQLTGQIHAVEAAGVDLMHLDVMDAHFVPPLSFGTEVVAAVRAASSLPIEVHLMVERPSEHIKSFAQVGADTQIFHYEAAGDMKTSEMLITQIRELGCEPALAVNPETDLETFEGLLPQLTQITVMTIQPGWGGQNLREDLLEKVSAVRAAANALNLNDFTIEIDGGVKAHNISRCVDAGANLIVAGSAVFNDQQTPAEAVAELHVALGRST
tara:strand:- start:33 stop:719 length:687 start_codon:yes stop_codon:yes gene_type:complete